MTNDKWNGETEKRGTLLSSSIQSLHHSSFDTYEIISRIRECARSRARPCLTLGVFDGLHLGHQLVDEDGRRARAATGAVPTVITFDPHPRAVLHPESAPPLLQTLDQKVEAFGVLGIEQTIVIRFNEEFAQMRAADFLA